MTRVHWLLALEGAWRVGVLVALVVLNQIKGHGCENWRRTAMSDEPIPVGASRDWQLDLYEAVTRTGETGLHLRLHRGDEMVVVFLGRAETAELIGWLERLLSQEEGCHER